MMLRPMIYSSSYISFCPSSQGWGSRVPWFA